MEFFRQDYWKGLPFPPSGDLPDPGIKPVSPALQADSLPSKPPEKPVYVYVFLNTIFFALICNDFYTNVTDVM